MDTVDWSNLQSEVISYTIAGVSDQSGNYAPENIRVDRPAEVQSRWTGVDESGRQWIILELSNVGVLDTMTFGKFHRSHPCNMKEFKVEVGLVKDNLSEVLRASLKNDTNKETFSLPRVTKEGLPLPSRFVKIIPLSAHGQNFHTSIWFVQLSGFIEEGFIRETLRDYERDREILALRHILKHLRQRRHLSIYQSLLSNTGTALEHPLLSELYEALVIKGDWARSESFLTSLSNAGLFTSYVHSLRPTARWRRLTGVDANGDVPSRRGGHAMCLDVENQRIYLFGGYDGRKSMNDFWVYDISTDRWSVISYDVSRENGPGPRACHKMVFDPKSGYIYLLGRLSDEDMPNMTQTQTVHENNEPSTDQGGAGQQNGGQGGGEGIEEVNVNADGSTTTAQQPQFPDGMRSTVHPPAKDYSSEFYRYTTRGIDQGQWKLLTIDTSMNGGPKLIYDHQLELDSEAQVIYVHGGRIIDGSWLVSKFSGMYSYDIRSGKWSSLTSNAHVSPSNEPMSKRFGHSMVFDSENQKLVVLAGQQESNRYLCDMWAYDLDRQSVLEISSNFTAAGGPEPCFAQRAVIDPELHEIYLFDGLKRRKNAETSTAESAVWMYQYADRPGKWMRVLPSSLPSPSPSLSPSSSCKPYHDDSKTHKPSGSGASKRSRSEMDDGAEDDEVESSESELELPLPRWAHQVVYDNKSKTFYMHGGNAGAGASSSSSSRSKRSSTSRLSKSRPGSEGTEARLDDLWSMTLERPPVEEVVRKAKFAIRRQQFREMCGDALPIKSLTFLQNEVSSVVNHNDEEEETAFRMLLAHLLQPSFPKSDNPERHTKPYPSSSRPKPTSPDRSSPSDHDHEVGWTNELPVDDEDTVMADARPVDEDEGEWVFKTTADGDTMSLEDDPYELRSRAGEKLSRTRFEQRTEVFESLLRYISPEEKQPEGSLLDMLPRAPVSSY